jgi:hypothetical protein
MQFGVMHPQMVISMVLFWPVGGAKYRLSCHQRFAEHLAFVQQNGIDPAKIEVIGSAVDLQKFNPSCDRMKFRREMGFTADTPFIASIGMIRPDKGQLILVDAARLVLSQRSDARFVIVGQGTGYLKLGEKVRNAISCAGLAAKVLMIGYRWDTPDIFAACDMVAIASLRTEASPIVLREAFAVGRPVVATKVGDIPEIIEHRQNGLLVEPGDSKALAAALSERGWKLITGGTDNHLILADLSPAEQATKPAKPVWEYRSRFHLLGWPVVHIIVGGRLSAPIRAWIAVGDTAIGGLFAFGGLSRLTVSNPGWWNDHFRTSLGPLRGGVVDGYYLFDSGFVIGQHTGQRGAVGAGDAYLLHADREPASPREWEEWLTGARQAIARHNLAADGHVGTDDIRLVHSSCHRRDSGANARRNGTSAHLKRPLRLA